MQEPENTLNVSVIWRGSKYVVEMNSCAFLKELGTELQKLTGAKADTMRLIVPKLSNKGSIMLSPFSEKDSCLSLQEASIVGGKPVRMMGVPQDEIDRVAQNAKADLRIAGFEEEEMRLKLRMSNGAPAVLKLPQGPYIFCDFRTLQIPGVELHPLASEALRRMHMLAADPGIVAIMNKHRWRVQIMTEMAPVGYVGISSKCILGFNKNHGEEISLRLRTDDLKGFRKYESIKKTLLHELAHMVYSEHDADFQALNKQLNEEAANLDWTKSRGHTLSGISHSQHEEDFCMGDGRTYSQKLGGNTLNQLESARASSVAAAYHRLATAVANNVEASKVHEEPDPDDSEMHEVPYSTNPVEKENLNIQGQNSAQLKSDHEPDLDDLLSNQNSLEPDPDDCWHGLILELKDHSEFMRSRVMCQNVTSLNPNQGTGATEEPGPDDSVAFSNSGTVAEPQLMEIVDNQSRKTITEPDPDEKETKQNILGSLVIRRQDQGPYTTVGTDQAQLNQAHEEPDPDESEENEISRAEPDPDDNLVPQLGMSSTKIDEPDPDDQELRRIHDTVTSVCSHLQKAIEMLQAEVDPTESTTVLQTLFKIIRNVIEHPNDMKFKRLRKANPVIQRNIANYKAAMNILLLVGFSEDVISDGIGKSETYLVMKRNDPGLLWLAKSSLEACIAY
ncbi:hypothetical protein SLEP1_g39558 [Rubroshorea leprosula]|uniref:WLM domain-containing protein n=1 Tax=Rubroshorea leprosula TaxID=152421 RepID=A0AAV5L0L0_9ROSI|nr:hypothetical protein SLEP1_g39558 [Rubroshorea leprosula]